MTDPIKQLERLQKLRESGALNDAEFEEEKRRLLAGGPSRGRRVGLWALAGLAAAIVLAVLILVIVRPFSPSVDEPVAQPQRDVAVGGPTDQTTEVALSAAERLSLAVRAVFPNGASLVDDGVRFDFVKHQLVDAPFGLVLVNEGQARDVAHVTAGRLYVAYLRARDGTLTVDRRYPKAVEVGSFGQMTEWAVSSRFSDLPVLYASGGFTGQGITEGCSILTELRPEGPTELVSIPNFYSNSGATLDNEPAEEIQGRIINIVKGRSFDVRYTGSVNRTVRYFRQGGRFVRQGPPVLDHCGD